MNVSCAGRKGALKADLRFVEFVRVVKFCLSLRNCQFTALIGDAGLIDAALTAMLKPFLVCVYFGSRRKRL
jgi:hypothetical protein